MSETPIFAVWSLIQCGSPMDRGVDITVRFYASTIGPAPFAERRDFVREGRERKRLDAMIDEFGRALGRPIIRVGAWCPPPPAGGRS